jgi:hypothetical protein
MVKYLVIFNLLIINNLLLHAAGNDRDSLVKYSDITFTTDFERQVITEYLNYGGPGITACF